MQRLVIDFDGDPAALRRLLSWVLDEEKRAAVEAVGVTVHGCRLVEVDEPIGEEGPPRA